MKKILIIDDEKKLVDAVRLRLEKSGYKVTAAFDGQEGFEKARAEKPDLIILDLVLPKMDGYKVCEMLKTDKALKGIPVVMLTARGKGLDLEKIVAFEFGADAYITKPFKPEDLLLKISDLFKIKP